MLLSMYLLLSFYAISLFIVHFVVFFMSYSCLICKAAILINSDFTRLLPYYCTFSAIDYYTDIDISPMCVLLLRYNAAIYICHSTLFNLPASLLSSSFIYVYILLFQLLCRDRSYKSVLFFININIIISIATATLICV